MPAASAGRSLTVAQAWARSSTSSRKRAGGARKISVDSRVLPSARGLAHAILTLTDDVEALYLVSAFYAPKEERGVRWDDPRFKVEWPIAPVELSAKDSAWPDFDPEFHGVEALRGLR